MTPYASPRAYRDSAVLTASPEQLVVMLYDGAVRFLRQGEVAMKEGAWLHGFEKVLDPITRAGDGLLEQRVNEANSDLSYIKDQLADMDTRLQSKEDYLRSQFTAMETALSQSQSTSSWLTSQLSS